MGLEAENGSVDLTVPRAVEIAGGRGVAKGGFNRHDVQPGTHFVEVGFKSCLVFFELGLFGGNFSDVELHFGVFTGLGVIELSKHCCEFSALGGDSVLNISEGFCLGSFELGKEVGRDGRAKYDIVVSFLAFGIWCSRRVLEGGYSARIGWGRSRGSASVRSGAIGARGGF